MYKENKGGTIKCSDLDGKDLPGLFRRVAKELEGHSRMRVESVQVIRYPTNYSYLNHGFTIELGLMLRE